MVAREAVLGLVLCGGASRRMGRDKARVEWRGVPLIQHALAILDPVAESSVLATGHAPRYAELDRPCVLDPVPDAGPLGGLVAGLEAATQSGARWLAVLAVDVPSLSSEVFRNLLQRAEAEGAAVSVLRHAQGLEPLVGVYRADCAPAARRALESGERRVVSFWPGLRTAHLDGVPPANMNTPDDLSEASA